MVALGLFLIRHHNVVWSRQQADDQLSSDDQTYYHRQYRRRVQTSGLLAVIGIVMLLGNLLKFDKDNQIAFLVWVISLLLLVLWVLLSAMGDWLAIRAHAQAALTEVRMQRMALEREAERLREQQRGNGNGKRDREG